MARKTREVRRTLLVVGEGDCEVAFLRHLREAYCSQHQGVNVTIRNAHGKGPENVVEQTRRKVRSYSYDQVVSLLDTDIPWSTAVKKVAKQAKIEMVGSTPCLEGLLLSILGERASEQSTECKKTLRLRLGVDMTERDHYARHFPKMLLDQSRLRISELDRLLGFFEGG